MSTILKALRRLEEEKTAPVGRRPLREEVAHTASAPRPRRGAWAVGAAALAGGVAVGASLLVVWPRGDAHEQPPERRGRAASPPPTSARPLEAATSPPEFAPSRATSARASDEPQGLSDAALASPVAVVPRPEPKPLMVDEPETRSVDRVAAGDPEPPAPGRPPDATRPATPAEKSLSPGVASAPPEAAPVPVGAAEAARAAAPLAVGQEDVAGPAAGASSGSVASAGLPAESSSWTVSDVRVEQTLWHPSPDRRVAVLVLPGRGEPLRVHEGDAVGALVVSEIEPSGVVFTREGQRLRRALGEGP